MIRNSSGGVARTASVVVPFVVVAVVALMVGSPLAGAAVGDAPEVSTPSVDDITQTAATFEGEVNPNGLATTYRFEYRRAVDVDWTSVPEGGDYAGNDTEGDDVDQDVEGLEPGTEYRVRLVATNSTGTTTSGEATFETLPALPPSVSTPTVSDVRLTAATFEGTLNPNGSETTYSFEYRRAADVDWTAGPGGNRDGTEDEDVSASVDGLEPETEYRVRLVATNESGTTTSGEATFETLPIQPPGVSTPILTDVTMEGARFTGRVTPNGGETGYRFEYRRAGDVEWVRVPEPDESIGAGAGSVAVSREVTGLDADTDYRVRLVATNERGTSTSSEQSFTTSLVAPSPVTRAYEKVSPPDKNGGNAFGVVLDDDHVSVEGNTAFFDDDPGLGGFSRYLATRGSSGWSLTPTLLAAGDAFFDPGTVVNDFSDDLAVEIIRGLHALLDADQDSQFDLYARTADGLELVSAGSIGGNGSQQPEYRGRSADGSHIVFETQEVLEPEDSGRTSGPMLYERVGGQTRAVGLDSDENPINSGGARLGDGPSSGGYDNPVSADGSRIFFSSPVSGDSQLYARMDGESTLHVSAPQRSTPGNAPQDVVFQGASVDGSLVFFSTTGQLVDDDSDERTDLYRYDLDSDQLSRLSNQPGGEDQNVEVEGMSALSDDGSRVYFSTQPADEGSGAASSIYLYDEGAAGTRFVAQLGPVDPPLVSQGLNFASTASVTPDGTTFVFPSQAKLTAFDNAGRTELYRYRAGQLTCVSCNRTGQVPLGEVNEGELWRRGHLAATRDKEPTRLLSDDGSVVVFHTPDALLSEDSNGQLDVYEWRDGELSLVTLGTGPEDSRVAGITPDGSDLFFETFDRLVPGDVDDQQDVYDARIGGGFPPPPPEPPSCSGDGCQGAPSSPPPSGDPGSRSFRGPGNAQPRRRPAFRVRRVTPRQSARLARGRRVALRVRVNQPGKVTVRMRAKIGKRRRQVARGSKRARTAGTVRILVRLSKPARRRLARGSRLPVSVLVRFAGVRETQRLTLRLPRPRSGARRSTARQATVPATSDGR